MTSPRSWLIPASTAFAVTSFGLLAGSILGPGCQTRCDNNFDCGGGAFCKVGRCETECYTNLDCITPVTCRQNPGNCASLGVRCSSIGKCVGRLDPPRHPPAEVVDFDGAVGDVKGWDWAPGAGRAFIVNQIAVAGKDAGFNLNSACDENGCIDNYLWRLGELGNDQIRQGLLGGESLLLVELAGLTEPFHGDEKAMTVKIYGARDADDPFFPADNFKKPPGRTTCCQFKINPGSIVVDPEHPPQQQARARSPAEIDRGALRSLAPVPIQFTLTVGQAPHPEIRLERVLIKARVPPNLDEISDGILGGAVPVNTLAGTENPYCKTISPRCPTKFTDSTLIDLVSTLLGPRPDVDLDFDGNECALDTDGNGAIDLCCDGAVTGCRQGITSCPASNPIASTSPGIPALAWKCALNPELADGYSITLSFTAVPATIVETGQ